MQALVVYYSRTGHTKKIGDEIAKAIPGDVEEIVDTANRAGPVGWLMSGSRREREKAGENPAGKKRPCKL